MADATVHYWGHFLSWTEADRFAAVWSDETGYRFAVDGFGGRFHVRRVW